ncbi:hypothetical protein B7C42_07674 [Nocardia cerradoensis]|uniref:DUF4913 domain-containing protein n=1 Tax=Nocardia cerradoensis TaxID=85688 RepID=A0A231GUE9_9NOCA|nr:DUF4913 domain-containing protein [Nocardia cerradoensis]OXR40249.1 hypothetical protein B7C42_07674 [Nocardia cerradoensis]
MTDTTTSTNGAAPTNGAGPAAAQIIPTAELGELMDAVVRKAVSAKFAEKAKDIAAEVVEKLLTPEIREQMAETAAHEAELALNPPVVVEPEPEPEPVVVAEEKPKNEYDNEYDFVQDYVCNVYRREIAGSSRTAKQNFRWCPQWWRHGEARGRLKALWTAFEALRQGETVEQSVFWLTHFGPQMNALMDPEGPFKHCSPEGHNIHGVLAELPMDPWPGETEAEATASGLVVPTGPTVHHQRIIRTDFP